MSEKIIAACGNDCAVCPRYVAHPYEKTEEELRHTAELWMKIGYRDHLVSNEEISCTGCKPENWCRYRVVNAATKRESLFAQNAVNIRVTTLKNALM